MSDTDSDRQPRALPPFPVDDFTLDQLEHALGTCIDGPIRLPFISNDEDDAPVKLVGGEFTLPMFLDFMSGADHSRVTHVGYAGDTPVYESWDPHYSEHDVLRALINEVRRLRMVDVHDS